MIQGLPRRYTVIVDALEVVARGLAQEAARRARESRPRLRRGATLRPGDDTPLWNALVELAKPLLARRGSRAILAAELGVHRARIREYFFERTSMPDAERALLLLVLLAREERGEPEPRGARKTRKPNVRNTNISPKTGAR